MLLVVLLLLPAGSASAAAITLSDDPEAESPAIAVGAAGTGHVAWIVSGPSTPDEVVYCRLPRGASACERTQVLTPDALESFSAPTVLDRGDGRIEVIASRCCNERTWAMVSTDGGSSFAPPKEIGTFSSDVGAPGPGADTVGLTDDSLGGAAFQFAPIDAPGPRTTAAATLGAGEFWYARGTGLIDSTTPIAVFSDLGSVGYRVFDPTRGPDYNDAANWSDPRTIPDLSESQVTSGLSGTFLLGVRPPALGQAVEVRRFDPNTGAFGAPVDLTRGTNEGPIFPSLFEDADGGVHATWVQNGRAPGGEDQLRHAFSADGLTWTAPETIDVDAGYSFRTGAAADHGGWVVSDQNSGGPIEAAVIPVGGATPVPAPPPSPPTTPGAPGVPGVPGTPPPAGDPALTSGPPTAPATACNVVTITNRVEARAQGGCFEDGGSGRRRTTADVRLNGLDFLTPGADATVTIDPAANRVVTSGDVVQKAGSVVLHRGAVDWDLDGTTTFDDLSGEGINLLGLPVRGKATVRFGQLSTDVTLNLLLPDPFSGVTGTTTLRTTQAAGLRVDGVHISVAEASVGLLTIQQLDLTFSSGFSTFEGKGKFLLPPNDATLEVGFGIKDGKFSHAEIPYYDGPPLPVPLATSITLQAIGFGVSVADGFQLDGRVVVGAGSLGGAAPITVDGTFRFVIPKGGGTAVLTAGGKLKLVSLQLATAQATLTTAGLFTFSGAASFAGLDATVAGGVDLPTGSFYATGKVRVCVLACGEGALIVSSVGAYGCASVGALGVEVYAGVGVVWPADPELAAGTGGCDVDDFVPAALRAAPGPRQASGALSVPVEGGSEQVALRIRGAGGALPAVAVVAPGGATVASDPADPAKAAAGKGVLLLPDARTGTVQAVAQRPPAGAFTVTPIGGAAIAGIDRATGPKPPTVRARVLGRGRDRTIRWSVADRSPGTTVRFVERSAAGIAHVLPRVKGARGAQRLRVTDGPGGRRTIEALVERGGTPRRGSGTVASFVAPGPATPGRVRLRARRSGSALVVRWTRSRDAARYRIAVTTGDGRLLQLRRGARTRSLRVPLAVADAARVTVRGESASFRAGPAASGRVVARRR